MKKGLNIEEIKRHTKASQLKAILEKSEEAGVNIYDLREFIYNELYKLGFDILNNKLESTFSDTELKDGYVKINGCDNATGFERICKESELQKVGKEIFAEHPGEDGYYNFTKYLWVNYHDERPECRLDDLVFYD